MRCVESECINRAKYLYRYDNGDFDMDDIDELKREMLRVLACNYGTDTPAERRISCMDIAGSAKMYDALIGMLQAQGLIEVACVINLRTGSPEKFVILKSRTYSRICRLGIDAVLWPRTRLKPW